MRSRSSPRRVPARRSQIAFMRGAWTAVRKILVPAAWKTASNEAVKFDPRSRIRNLMSSNRSPRPRARLRACCTVHSPVGFAVTPSDVHPAGAMLDEYQHVYALQQHTVHVQEIGCDDPGGLGAQELPPGRAIALRRGRDLQPLQHPPHRGRTDPDAEAQQFTLDPLVSPAREMLSSTFPGLCGTENYVEQGG